MSTESRVVLVTGGTGKLGRSFLQGFARLGHSVAFTTRDASQAAPLRDECLAWGAPAALAVEADLASADGVAHVIAGLDDAALQPAVLINSARSIENLRPETGGFVPRERWQREFELGVTAAYMLTMELARVAETKLDAVVNIASMYGVTAANRRLYDEPDRDSAIHYGVVKAALIHLTKELAVRLAPAVRVNAVSFGGVGGRVPAAFEARYAALCPSGRMLSHADVFGPVRFLAGEESSGMTGHNVVVDGGWTIW
jgi:NAD(P)-dependent dehydrogenase (short-subunit alcohol dehydrogenase family)